MTGMNRAILILAVLMALVIFVQCRSMVNLAGEDGNQLFREIAKNSTENSSLNLSINSSGVELAGDAGSTLMNDVINASKNLSDWGNKPPNAPLPPKYDAKTAMAVQVLRVNHGYA